MFKRSLLALSVLVSVHAHSQELNKQLQSGKWFINGGLIRKSVVLHEKPANAKDLWEARFLPSGKMMRCDTIHGSLFTGDGKDMKINMVECDSTNTYTLKKDVLKISNPKNSYYYKVKTLPDKSIELTSATAEDFEKK